MLNQIEIFVNAHQNFITLAFTLVLIISSIAYTLISYINVREIKKQFLLQEWINLRNILSDSQLSLFNFKSQAASVENEQQGTAYDEAVSSIEHIIGVIGKQLKHIEERMKIK